jgi:hypothetical protein
MTGTILGLFAILGTGFGFAALRTDAFVTPCTAESEYYCIRIENFAPQSGRPSAVMVLDHLAHGINDRDLPRLLYSTYLQFVDEYVRHRFEEQAIDVFAIGGGALTLPRAWAQSRPDSRIVVAEIDPEVTRAARERMWVAEDPSTVVRHDDGRVILQSLPALPSFDAIFGDAFHDISIPAHLVTREFHRALKARLKPDGVYAVNVIESGRNPRFLASLVRTLAQDFAAVEVWLDAEDARNPERINYVVIAGARPSATDLVQSTRGMRRSWLRLAPEQLAERADVANAPVLTDDFAPVDRLLAHIIFDPALAER